MSGKKYTKNREFQELAARIHKAIVANDGIPDSPKMRDEQQKAQVEKLYKLEKRFKNKLLYYQQTKVVYKKFAHFIKFKKGNILTAQPYFRESGKVFSKHIAKAIKEDDVEELLKYDINALLAQFIVNNWEGEFPKRIATSYRALLDVRRILVENNMPLAINQAKRFFYKTPKDKLTLLDFINISTYGLVSGTDKYVGTYTKVWRSVCIGRMVGFMIEEYSKTFIRLYPSDKKILYRAMSLKYRLKLENLGDLVEAVNESFEKDKENGKSHPKEKVTEHQLICLMNSSHYWSADTKPPLGDGKEDEAAETIYECTADKGLNPEEQVIQDNLISKMQGAVGFLNLIERKIVQLKGVDI